MFDKMKQMQQLMSLIGDPNALKEKFEHAQAELETMRCEGQAGGGAVKVVTDGKLKVLSIQMDPAAISGLLGASDGPPSDEDRAMLEQLMLSAVNDALGKAQDAVKSKLSEAAGGLSIPGLT